VWIPIAIILSFGLRLYRSVRNSATSPDRYSDFLDHTICDGLDEPLAAIDEVSATIATVDGLLLDLLTTGDRIRLNNATEQFVFWLRWHAARPRWCPTRRSKAATGRHLNDDG
jgi:hypothetical protein